MAKQAQISDILDKPATQIDRPKPLPAGTYRWLTIGLPRKDKSKEKQTEFYEFTCKCMGVYVNEEGESDVDEEALNDWAQKSDGTSRALTDFTQKLTFYVTPDSLYRLQEFLEHLAIPELDEKTTRQAIDDSQNCEFIGAIVHKASPDGTQVYANIGKTAPVED